MKATGAANLDLSTLPEEARQEITDFYLFLKKKYRRSKNSAAPFFIGTTELKETGFIGIWKDRADMNDSAGWVRQVRESAWSRHE
jgi:hypothetical protein